MTKPNAKLTKAEMYDIIRSPIVTEKTSRMSENNQVAFRVRLDATKPDIAAAVAGIFDVKVLAVNTLRMKGKKKLFKGRPGRRSDYKKAMVTLEKTETLDPTVGV